MHYSLQVFIEGKTHQICIHSSGFSHHLVIMLSWMSLGNHVMSWMVTIDFSHHPSAELKLPPQRSLTSGLLNELSFDLDFVFFLTNSRKLWTCMSIVQRDAKFCNFLFSICKQVHDHIATLLEWVRALTPSWFGFVNHSWCLTVGGSRFLGKARRPTTDGS